MSPVHVCATCQRGTVRLYRPYGEFFRPARVACNAHIPGGAPALGWYVPLCADTDGTVWGYTSVPPDAITRWEALPDADPAGPIWRAGGWS